MLIHVKTQKGKGYAPAEENPDRYHGLSPKSDTPKTSSFSAEFGKALCHIANENEDVCAITAAMRDGTGLRGFGEQYPERFFDVGIAEPHAVTFAAGLAAAGKRPVVAIYSTFLQRAYDNIIHDVALQNLPVCFCIDRAGLNDADGPTHHGIFDVSFLSSIPNMTIYTPATYGALAAAMREAMSQNGPVAIRYPRGAENPEVLAHFYGDKPVDAPGLRRDFTCNDELDAVIVTHGRIVSEAIKAKGLLAQKGIRIGILLAECIKPYDKLAVLVKEALGDRACPIVTLEEEIRSGGFGISLADRLTADATFEGRKLAVMAPTESFVEQTKHEDIFETAGVSAEDIVEKIQGLIA